jgi:hypothetical protein
MRCAIEAGRPHKPFPKSVAPGPQWACKTTRATLETYHRAYVDQTQAELARAASRKQFRDGIPKRGVSTGTRTRRPDSKYALENTQDVRINERSSFVKRDGQDGVRDVPTYAGEGEQRRRVGWNLPGMTRDQCRRHINEPRTSMREPEWSEELGNFRSRRCSQHRRRRVARREAVEDRGHEICPRPLEHDFGDQDLKRIVGLTPGEVPAKAVEPFQNDPPKPTPLRCAWFLQSVGVHHAHFRCVRRLTRPWSVGRCG